MRINVKQKTKGVNSIRWFNGEIKKKNQTFHKKIQNKNPKSK
jgi:uncharacterized protein YodC (DUF2158 family)